MLGSQCQGIAVGKLVMSEMSNANGGIGGSTGSRNAYLGNSMRGSWVGRSYLMNST